MSGIVHEESDLAGALHGAPAGLLSNLIVTIVSLIQPPVLKLADG